VPFKGKTKLTDSQRRKIATGKVAGKTSREIAADAGLSESTVKKQASDPRTITLIQKLIARDAEQLDRMWQKSLKSIEKDLDSKDSSLAISARRDFLKFAVAGDPPLARVDPASISGDGLYSLEELLTSWRRFEQQSQESDAGARRAGP
jgi:hypothetical protein